MTADTTTTPANANPAMVPELPRDSPFLGGEGEEGGGGDDFNGERALVLDVDEPDE